MQRYAEGYQKKDYSGARALPRFLMVAGVSAVGLTVGLLALILTGFTSFSYVFAVALFACTLGALKFLWRFVDVAYEYTIVEDELRVVKILGDVSRRPMVTIPLRNVKEKGKLADLTELPATVYEAVSAPDAEDACYVKFVENENEAILLWNGKEKLLALMPWGRNC